MTIMDAINTIDILKPNRYEQAEKIRWLNTLDKRIMDEVISVHESESDVTFTEYTEETVPTTELLAPSPYEEMYFYWLEAQIDYWNGEYTKYNNSIEMFNTLYKDYARSYNRTNKPKGKKFKFF